jgi:hypothetical protein
MTNVLFIFLILIFVSCGKNGKNGSDGIDGSSTFGLNGSSSLTGIDFSDLSPGLACINGGISIFTFQDINSDAIFDEGESIIKVKALCNGINGIDGANGAVGVSGADASITLESIVTSASCPNGGVKFTSGSLDPVEVCNGVNGINGEQGLPGVQGIPGVAGSNGSNGNGGRNITPVKFCPSDNSTFPEYGLMIGTDLFAVYWGTTPASPTTPQAFLTKLVAGNYMSTGGNNCIFTIP